MPRRSHELSAKVNQATDKLTNELQRSPKVEEIAEYLGVTVDEVLEAMESVFGLYLGAHRGPARVRFHDAPSILDRYAHGDNQPDFTDDRLVIEEAIREFPPREREVIELRFVKGMTKIEIARSWESRRCKPRACCAVPLRRFKIRLTTDGATVRS